MKKFKLEFKGIVTEGGNNELPSVCFYCPHMGRARTRALVTPTMKNQLTEAQQERCLPRTQSYLLRTHKERRSCEPGKNNVILYVPPKGRSGSQEELVKGSPQLVG